MNKIQTLGHGGESRAEEFLKERGYQVIDRNFHSRFGEIDIIAKDHDTLVFIEVKARLNNSYGSPEESVTPKKIDKIIKTGQYYCLIHNHQNLSQRIDVIAIDGPEIRHLKNVTQ